MAFALATHFLLFLWFSGVNQLEGVHPSSITTQIQADSDYPNSDEDSSSTDLLLPVENRRWHDFYNHPQYPPHFPKLPRLSVMPPSHIDPIQEPLKRHYRLEDFLWSGSGDGPHPSEQDGGLAWEDNGGSAPPHGVDTKNWIRVTKTMTLYRTVLTTIYPVEMTPTVVSGVPIQPTPHFSPGEEHSPTPTLPPPGGGGGGGGDSYLSASPSDYQSSENVMWIPTPTFSPTGPPLPTVTPPTPPAPPSSPRSTPSSNLGEGEEDKSNPSTTTTSVQITGATTPVPPSTDNFSAASTDPLYWIQTSIKANNSAFRDTPHVFQTAMQKSLARVYASAFKRHLLATLGVLPNSQSSKGSGSSSNNNRKKRRRRKRWSYHGGEDQDDLDEDNQEKNHLDQWLYVAQSSMSPTQLKNLATTAMNVTVTIINVTTVENLKPPAKVDLRYVVLAEGTPVPAFSAVKELALVSKREMEEELGYEIIDKKAEALVAGPPEQIARNEQYVATSPWLIVAVTTICLLVILLVLIAFMVWKWKHNRLGDSGRLRHSAGAASAPPRPQSGTIEIEDGVINPAFLGTPSRIGRGETLDQSPRSSPGSRLLSGARARTAKKISEVLSRRTSGGSKSRGKVKDDGDEDDGGQDVGDKKKRKLLPDNSLESSSEDLKVHRRRTTAALTSSEGSADWKELLGEPRPKLPQGARKRSPVRASGGAKSGKATAGTRDPKDVLRRRRRKSKVEEANLKTDEDGEEDDEDGEEDALSQFSGLGDDSPPKTRGKPQQQPWTKGLSDAISLGNLDIFQDTIAQTPSEYAKKLVPWRRPGSAIAAAGPGKQSQPYFLPSGLTTGASGGIGGGATTRPGSRLALRPPQETIEEIPSYDLTEEEDGGGRSGGGGSREQDRDLSEKSFELRDSPVSRKSPATSPGVDTKDAQVQTPTRISKTASHKQRAAPKPRKSWRGSPGGGGGESVLSTESEEIVEVHHINTGMPEEQNPLGRMRKRFHQFLDDAFNVMVSGGSSSSEHRGGGIGGGGGGGGGNSDTRPTQSAKVSISHEVVETETEWRPWTSHVIREETLQKLRRPKSAAVPIGPPKRAWTAGSEGQQQRTQSAKSQLDKGAAVGSHTSSRMGSAVDIQGPSSLLIRKQAIPRTKDEDDEDSYDKTSTAIDDDPSIKYQQQRHPLSSSSDLPQSRSQSVVLSPAFIFPQYPAYPDIRVGTPITMGGGGLSSTSGSSSLSQPPSVPPAPPPPPPTLASNDPAVPLIQAIKDEMKKFEKTSPPT